MSRLLIYLAFFGLGLALSVRGAELEPGDFWPEHCPSGFHHQPNGPFAVVLFCEDALGNYLGVVYADPMGSSLEWWKGRWNLNDRYWHEPVWGSDVTGFQWSKDGTKLLVSTHQVYGSGGLFELDLRKRTARQRLPVGGRVSIEHPGPGYDINGKPLGEP